MIQTDFWFMNAAGWAKTVDQVDLLAAVPYLTHIDAGSFTILGGEGNTGGTNFDVAADGTATNSLGLPNYGLAYLEKHLRQMCDIAQKAKKQLVVNIAANSAEDFVRLACAIIKIASGYKIILEINVGCPNVYARGKQKPIISLRYSLLRPIILELNERVNNPMWLKVSPTTDVPYIARVSRLVAKTNFQAVVATNTIPNGCIRDSSGKPLLQVTNGEGGLSGPTARALALMNAHQYRKQLPPHIDVIGVTGVDSGRSALDYLHVPCRGFQVGTAFFHGEDFRVFRHIMEGLSEYLEDPTIDA